MTGFKFCPQCAKPLEPRRNEEGEERPACPDGHFVYYDNPIPTSIALVEHGGKYLIVRRAYEPQKGEWDLPGGFIEAGEHPVEAVKRELKEETGLEITVQEIVGAYPSTYGDEKKRVVGIVFRATADTDAVELSKELLEYDWRPLADIPELAFQDTNDAVAELRRRED